MLCAPDSSMCAQDAEHTPSTRSTTQTSLIHDPYDPRINTEYEILVRRWNHRLLQRSQEFVSSLENPATVIKDTKEPLPAAEDTSKHQQWLIDMDRFFEELWLDAQHMLQCAQAWNYSSALSSPSTTADTLSLKDAVRSMNIFGLRVMQRTLYARQILLKSHRHQQPPIAAADAADASPLLALWKASSESTGANHSVQETPEEHDRNEKSIAQTEPHTSRDLSPPEEEDEDDEQQMNAPLLRRTYHQSLASNCGCPNIGCSCDDKNRQSASHPMQETMTMSSWVGLLPYPPVRRPKSCFPATTAATTAGGGGPSPTTTRRQRRQLASSTAATVTPPQLPTRSASTRGPLSLSRRHYPRQRNDVLSMASSSGMSNMDEDGLWKSWFGNNNDGSNCDGTPLCARTASNSVSSSDYGGSSSHVPQSVGDDTEDLTAAYQHGSSDDDDDDDDLESITLTNRRQAATMAPSSPMDEKAQIDSPIEEARLHRLHLHSSSSNTKDMAVVAPPLAPSSLKMMRGYGFTNAIARSESSISAFRPISKNLAPRCPRDHSFAESEPSPSLVPEIQPIITKSKSFPSKVVSVSSSPSDESFPSPTLVVDQFKPLPHPNSSNHDPKERNFVMRSIVGKKASLGKLFSAKK